MAGFNGPPVSPDPTDELLFALRVTTQNLRTVRELIRTDDPEIAHIILGNIEANERTIMRFLASDKFKQAEEQK